MELHIDRFLLCFHRWNDDLLILLRSSNHCRISVIVHEIPNEEMIISLYEYPIDGNSFEIDVKLTSQVIKNVMEIDTNLFQYKHWFPHCSSVEIHSLYSNVSEVE